MYEPKLLSRLDRIMRMVVHDDPREDIVGAICDLKHDIKYECRDSYRACRDPLIHPIKIHHQPIGPEPLLFDTKEYPFDIGISKGKPFLHQLRIDSESTYGE